MNGQRASRPVRFGDPLGQLRKVKVGYASGGSGGGLFGSLGRAGRSVWRAVPSFPDDHYANMRGKAEAGFKYDTKGLTPAQRANVNARARVGRERRGK